MSTTRRVAVGIDVSKRTLDDVCLMPDGQTFAVANDQEGIDSLIERLERMRPELVVLEATGRYERPAAAAIAASGIPVAVVNPRQSRDFAKATARFAKTDRIDAEILARFAEAVGPKPSSSWMPSSPEDVSSLGCSSPRTIAPDGPRGGGEAHPGAHKVAREGAL